MDTRVKLKLNLYQNIHISARILCANGIHNYHWATHNLVTQHPKA